MNRVLILAAAILMVAACKKPAVDPIVEPSDKFPQLTNSGFEDGLTGWNLSGNTTVAGIEKGYSGQSGLSIHGENGFSVTLMQTITDAPDGLYDLSFQTKRSFYGMDVCYVKAGDRMTAIPESREAWNEVVIRGIRVSGGRLSVSIVCEGSSEGWLMVDDFTFSEGTDFTVLKGGDLSYLNYVEDNGGHFYSNGKEVDVVKFAAENGWNIVRLRVYNDPGNALYYPSNEQHKGYQDINDILKIAKRVKAAGMKICLSFHYSDSWTNPGAQYIPHEWMNKDFEGLQQAIYDYTYDCLKKMEAQGTLPEYVSIGNECNCGMLFGTPTVASAGKNESTNEYFMNYKAIADFVTSGHKAVKAVSEDIKTIYHTSAAGSDFSWLYDAVIKEHGGQFDMFGYSYYPYWTGKTSSEIRVWADNLCKKYNKDLIFMENGFNWNRTAHWGGESYGTGPYDTLYPEISPLGQKNWLTELMNEIKKADGCRIAGSLFWDPICIYVKGVPGLDNGNSIDNTTLFDFEGNALESWDAYRYNN